MKHCSKTVLILFLSLLWTLGISVSAQESSGVAVTCDDGSSFNNGVEVTVVQMRAGFSYTATAIGIGDFDPVLAVLDANGRGLCANNIAEAANYSADLPTTGAVASSRNSAQVQFSQTSGQNMADVSIVVGSVGSADGEFVLILEGMAATRADGRGDPFAVRLTPGMVASDVPLTVYMISVTNALDPHVSLVDQNLNGLTDDNGNFIYCDDSGSANFCWGDSSSLASSYVTRRGNQRLGGFSKDAMLSLPIQGIELNTNPNERFLHYLMTSYQQSTFGDYVVAIHAGTTSAPKGAASSQQATALPTLPPKDNTTSAPSGVSVTCDNGASFDNGVEVQVVQMRAGFTYTATAVGINGFDPVLAVLDANGRGLCADNTSGAASYSLDLPTTGTVAASRNSAQVQFNQTSGQNMADVSVVVGSVGNTTGEFVLVLEGMAATSADGRGDPFAIRLTPGMVASGVPLTVYMISVTNALDPLIAHIDGSFEDVFDSEGNRIYCDDAGNSSLCWGSSSSLNGSYVTRRGTDRLGGFGADAMLSMPLNYNLNADPDLNFLNFLMTSYQQSTFGDYIIAFHVGLGLPTGNA